MYISDLSGKQRERERKQALERKEIKEYQEKYKSLLYGFDEYIPVTGPRGVALG